MGDKTTAQLLGAFYKELIKEGIPESLAYSIVLDAARNEIENAGLVVSND